MPSLVLDAVSAAERLGFDLCVRPEIGRLLGVLAAGLPTGAIVGETGTGTGAGLAWLVTHAPAGCRFLSYELDPERAEAARSLFADHDNVTITTGDAAELFDQGPFDLLVLDGGPGSGKTPGDTPVEPTRVLRPGGTITIDDYTPTTTWPPSFGNQPDHSRIHWLTHPDLRASEIRVASDLAVIVGRYLP
ncbi:MAG: class I SAM-dependent methyltransferase [Acidimicrobiales bacterium]